MFSLSESFDDACFKTLGASLPPISSVVTFSPYSAWNSPIFSLPSSATSPRGLFPAPLSPPSPFLAFCSFPPFPSSVPSLLSPSRCLLRVPKASWLCSFAGVIVSLWNRQFCRRSFRQTRHQSRRVRDLWVCACVGSPPSRELQSARAFP